MRRTSSRSAPAPASSPGSWPSGWPTCTRSSPTTGCGPCWPPVSGELEVLDGRAEEIPVADSSFDVVIAQSAWHWVDEERAVPEVARVLRPGGRLSLVWTGPDRSVDWMRSLWAGGIIFSPEEAVDEDSRRRRRHLVNVDVGGVSPFLEPETKLFRWTKPMTKADLVALAATYSAVITMEDDARREHLDAMTRFLDDHRALRRTRRHRRPHALLLLAGHEALIRRRYEDCLRDQDKGP